MGKNFTKSSFNTYLLFVILCLSTTVKTHAQCPTNIDFEDGTFNGWTCYVGSVAAVGTTNVITLAPVPGPVPNRHTMLSAFPGNGLDEYGGFPQNCPNGSSHSIKLGNNSGGHEAEGVSYTFTIPATANQYSLIYYYAVVFQNPNHQPYQQPRLEISIQNLTDNTTVGCSSFAFVAAGNLPGFFVSPINNTVFCKDWSANSINLDGNAGKTIQIFFKTADCTFQAHFGYAYIDVNTECSSSFVGAAYCADDTAINVRAPYGYQNYTWWNSSFTQILGNQQILHISPPPPSGTVVAVDLTPFNGYGCQDTLYAHLFDTLTVHANAGPDKLACDSTPVQLGGPPVDGFVYSWSPTAGLSNPNISNPIASPAITTTYVLTVRHDGGGCMTTDTVVVNSGIVDSTITLIGSATYCTGSGGSTILQVHPTDSIQWFKDNIAIPGANQTQLIVTQTGIYFAMLYSHTGCSVATASKQITINPSPVALFTVDNANQCLNSNQFNFTNASSVASGGLQYSWDMGDGFVTTTTDISHAYANAGTYTVTLTVTATGGCVADTSLLIHVFAEPDSSILLQGNPAYCVGTGQAAVLVVQPTTSVQWFDSNGAIPGANQTQFTVIQSGLYYARLTNANGCSVNTASKQIDVYPTPSSLFAINAAIQCFDANQFVLTNQSVISSGAIQYLWSFGDGKTDTLRDVMHTYSSAGTYRINLEATALGGCKSDTATTVTVYPTPVADFGFSPVCVNLRVPILNTTVNNTSSTLNYLWDFGNGQTSTQQYPVYSYPVAGSFVLKLTVSSNQCPLSLNTKVLPITIDAPAPAINYPVVTAVMNYPQKLQARSFANQAIWSPATNLDNPKSLTPVFKGITPQTYTIQLTTAHGCVTIDTQEVKTLKKIAIYVPNGFSPNGDGINDYLRPTLTGFKSVTSFKVFNRWGQLVFQMSSDRPGWDGRVNQLPQDSQVYVWTIEAIDVDGVIHQDHGTTVLIR